MLEVAKVNMFTDAASFYFLSFEMVKLVWVTLSDCFSSFLHVPQLLPPVATSFCFGCLARSERKLVPLDWIAKDGGRPLSLRAVSIGLCLLP